MPLPEMIEDAQSVRAVNPESGKPRATRRIFANAVRAVRSQTELYETRRALWNWCLVTQNPKALKTYRPELSVPPAARQSPVAARRGGGGPPKYFPKLPAGRPKGARICGGHAAGRRHAH